MTDEAALLVAVLDRHDDDTPRLVYADWLDENGEPERAAFIRVMVERDRLPRWVGECKVCGCTPDDDGMMNHGRGCYMLDADGGGSDSADDNPAWHDANDRLRPLWNAGTDIGGWMDSPAAWGQLDWSRGFIERVTTAADDWLTHGDTILAAHPVRAVRLTTMADYADGADAGRFGLAGDPTGKWWSADKIINLRAARSGMMSADDIVTMLHMRWPRVAFTLPPPVVYLSRFGNVTFTPELVADAEASRAVTRHIEDALRREVAGFEPFARR